MQLVLLERKKMYLICLLICVSILTILVQKTRNFNSLTQKYISQTTECNKLYIQVSVPVVDTYNKLYKVRVLKEIGD